MLFPETICLVRGAGDLATGIIYRLRRAGFPVIALELEQPRTLRRLASFAQAVFTGEATVAGLVARRMTLAELSEGLGAVANYIPVLVDPGGEALGCLHPAVLVDARMMKSAVDTRLDQAPFVVAIGPGFTAGVHCHAVVETNRGHNLGRVLWHGSAEADTGRPEALLGHGPERVLRAPASGQLKTHKEIGDPIQAGDVIATVYGAPVTAPFNGMLRGLMYPELAVSAGEKIGDLDPRGQREACFTISDKSLAVGGGVAEAVLANLQQER